MELLLLLCLLLYIVSVVIWWFCQYHQSIELVIYKLLTFLLQLISTLTHQYMIGLIVIIN
jgi:hypothetical protein